MRLSAVEIAALRTALKGVPWAHVWLFGSRVDDSRRGGDIDILVHTAHPAFAVAHEISSRYAAAVDGQLDVLALDPQAMTDEQKSFVATLTLEPLDDLIGT
jgi:predicted nucleotidyltransferase